jgi:hypothetical protein
VKERNKDVKERHTLKLIAALQTSVDGYASEAAEIREGQLWSTIRNLEQHNACQDAEIDRHDRSAFVSWLWRDHGR